MTILDAFPGRIARGVAPLWGPAAVSRAVKTGIAPDALDPRGLGTAPAPSPEAAARPGRRNAGFPARGPGDQPKAWGKVRARARSRSAMATGRPRSTRLVTP